jgi:hypothetical protein
VKIIQINIKSAESEYSLVMDCKWPLTEVLYNKCNLEVPTCISLEHLIKPTYLQMFAINWRMTVENPPK